jgi:UDP-N-acetylglucosamine transferase subunit ALG13
LIFVTVGTHHQPFQRLLDALAVLPGESLVVQHGHGPDPPGVAYAVAFMPFDEMLGHFGSCDLVITHAGVGSILAATRAGHVPIVVPRLKRFGEHVDDHQEQLTRALAASGKVVPVWDVRLLAEVAASARRRRPVTEEEGGVRLAAAVRAAFTAA